jgi:hypothetical protein
VDDYSSTRNDLVVSSYHWALLEVNQYDAAKDRGQPGSEMGVRGTFTPYRRLHVPPEISYEADRRSEAIQACEQAAS